MIYRKTPDTHSKIIFVSLGIQSRTNMKKLIFIALVLLLLGCEDGFGSGVFKHEHPGVCTAKIILDTITFAENTYYCSNEHNDVECLDYEARNSNITVTWFQDFDDCADFCRQLDQETQLPYGSCYDHLPLDGA